MTRDEQAKLTPRDHHKIREADVEYEEAERVEPTPEFLQWAKDQQAAYETHIASTKPPIKNAGGEEHIRSFKK